MNTSNQNSDKTTSKTTPEAVLSAPSAPVASKPPTAKKKASPKRAAPMAKRGEKPAKAKTQAKGDPKAAPKAKKTRTKANGPRLGSKAAAVLAMIGRENGATASEIQKKMKWLPHTTRGFLSIAAKKYSLQLESKKDEAGDRVYCLR